MENNRNFLPFLGLLLIFPRDHLSPSRSSCIFLSGSLYFTPRFSFRSGYGLEPPPPLLLFHTVRVLKLFSLERQLLTPLPIFFRCFISRLPSPPRKESCLSSGRLFFPHVAVHGGLFLPFPKYYREPLPVVCCLPTHAEPLFSLR